MTIKSSQTLVSEALKNIKTITADDALKLSTEGKCTLMLSIWLKECHVIYQSIHCITHSANPKYVGAILNTNW